MKSLRPLSSQVTSEAKIIAQFIDSYLRYKRVDENLGFVYLRNVNHVLYM